MIRQRPPPGSPPLVARTSSAPPCWTSPSPRCTDSSRSHPPKTSTPAAEFRVEATLTDGTAHSVTLSRTSKPNSQTYLIVNVDELDGLIDLLAVVRDELRARGHVTW